MYVNSAYWHNKILDFKDKSKPLFVCSCGTYHLFTRPKLPTYRPRGRLDYQIIYVASGKAHFYFNGVEQIISAGNMGIYSFFASVDARSSGFKQENMVFHLAGFPSVFDYIFYFLLYLLYE